jgi:hypothetical protein
LLDGAILHQCEPFERTIHTGLRDEELNPLTVEHEDEEKPISDEGDQIGRAQSREKTCGVARQISPL